MQLRDHEGVKGKRDAYPFDPRLLKVDPGYNVRDLTTPEARSKLDELKEQIRHAGVRVPLEVRFESKGDNNDVFIVSGHRRHRAVMELIDEGVPIETVLVIQEPKGTNEAERALNLALSNSGEPLKPIELAQVVKRLTDFGWDHAQIARRMGWKSASSVRQHLDMLALPTDVQAAVKQGKVSASTARKSVAEIGGEATMKLIEDNAAQGKRTKPRDVPSKPKKTKAPIAQTSDSGLDDKLEQFDVQAAEERATADAALVDALGQQTSLSTYDFIRGVQPNQSQAPARHALNGFYSAAEPFAKALDLINWDEVEDDEPMAIEITGRDAKLFIQAWTRATGEA